MPLNLMVTDGNVFCFCSPCETCVRQQWLGHGQDAHKRNSRIRKKLYRKCRSMINMHGAWRHPYTFVKRRLQCVETTLMELLSMCSDHARVCPKIS